MSRDCWYCDVRSQSHLDFIMFIIYHRFNNIFGNVN